MRFIVRCREKGNSMRIGSVSGAVGTGFVFLTLMLLQPAEAWADEGTPGSSIRDRLSEVMSRSEFRSVRRHVFEKVPEADLDKGFLSDVLSPVSDFFSTVASAVGGWFRKLFELFRGVEAPDIPDMPSLPNAPEVDAGGALTLAEILMYGALLLGFFAIVGLIAWAIRSGDRRKNSAGPGEEDLETVLDVSIPPGEMAVSTYEQRATRYAANGDYRAAIRELLLGSMSWIERRGMIRFRKGLTNRDYLRAVWREVDCRSAYDVTAGEFERVFFGRRPATEAGYEACLDGFRTAFREGDVL